MLELNLDDPIALAMTGTVYQSMDCFGEAYHFNRLAAEKKPVTELCNNVALPLIELGLHEDAERWLRKALKRDPANAEAMSNMAVLMMRESRPQEARQWAEKALSTPGLSEDGTRAARENRGYACLALQDWGPGWEGYEAMIGRKWRPNLYPDLPYWNGEKGKRILVSGEQGLGDEISFASILPDAMKDNEIVLDCDARLAGLFARSFPSLEVHGDRFDKSASWRHGFDAHCLIGTLGKHYRSAGEFPGVPFLVADPERRLQWRALLDKLPGRKIGIAWTGGLPSTFRSRRSLALEQLLPILRTPDVSWISLQYLDPTDEIEAFTERHGIAIKHWARAGEAYNYDETAALVAELDLIICVTTSVVHLAGALGVPCWAMVPNKPRWFYGMNGDTSPWYESVRLFRQTDRWKPEDVARELATWLR